MSKKITSLVLLAFAAVFALACNDAAKPPVRVANQPVATPAIAQQQQAGDNHDEAAVDDAPRISLADAKKDFDNKTAVFVDTHAKEQFDLEHIPGAINVQANTIKQNLDKIPKGKKIIAYCS
jgi:hypothetical protein